MPVNETWLQQVHEAPIDPAYPIIDPHHHLWPLLGGRPRTADYLPADFARDATSGHNIIASVYLQCGTMYRTSGPEHLKPVGETEWVQASTEQQAHEYPGGPKIAAGIVGYTDLRLEQVDEVLEAHLATAPDRFRGIRQGSTWTDEVEAVRPTAIYERHMLLDAAFRRGFARLAMHGLSFDAWLYHPQLPELIDLARAFPDTRIVLNHFGGILGRGSHAGRREEIFAEWRKSITELSRCPNVYMKLGGSVMQMFGFAWEERPLPPTSDALVAASGHFYRTAIDCFSPARCMFESNFPVDKESCSYVVLWNGFKKMAAGFSATEREDMFRNTAARFYRLNV